MPFLRVSPIKDDRTAYRAVKRESPKRTGTTPVQTSQSTPMSCPTPCRARVQGWILSNLPPCRYLLGLIFLADGRVRSIFPLCSLSGAGGRLSPLRSWADLLRRWLCGCRPWPQNPRGRSALSGKPSWTPHACRTPRPVSGAKPRLSE